MNSRYFFSLIFISIVFSACQTDELKRIPYTSQVAGEERDFYLYLPNGYDFSNKNWPVLMFLHGNGERGNGKSELPFVMKHGPLMEAWTQKRDLPFIMIVPQLHMFGLDTTGISYLVNRDTTSIPHRLKDGVPPVEAEYTPPGIMDGATPEEPPFVTMPRGWDKVEQDLMGMIDYVTENYRADTNRVYLSGLSYGGFGTWFIASKNPERFAAIAPVVGWGHPSLMDPIAQHKIPVWAYAGGRDPVVPVKYFFDGLNRLEELGHTNVRFTIIEDMHHDAWKRVYGGDDLYQWLLEQSKPNE